VLDLAGALEAGFLELWQVARKVALSTSQEFHDQCQLAHEMLQDAVLYHKTDDSLSAQEKAAMTPDAVEQLIQSRCFQERVDKPKADAKRDKEAEESDGKKEKKPDTKKEKKRCRRKRERSPVKKDEDAQKRKGADDRKKHIRCFNCQKMGHYSNECKEPKAASRNEKEAQPAEKKRPASAKELAAVKEAMRRKYEANIGVLDRRLKAACDSESHNDDNKSLDALLAFRGGVDYAAHVSETVSLGQERHGLQEALATARETRAVTIKGSVEALEPHDSKQTWPLVVGTLQGQYVAMLMDNGTKGGNMMTARHAEALSIGYQPEAVGTVKGIGRSQIIGHTEPLEVTIGLVTQSLSLLVVDAQFEYPLLCCASVQKFGMPVFGPGDHTLRTGGMTFNRSAESTYFPALMVVGTPETAETNSERDNEGLLLAQQMRSNTFGKGDRVAFVAQLTQDATAHWLTAVLPKPLPHPVWDNTAVRADKEHVLRETLAGVARHACGGAAALHHRGARVALQGACGATTIAGRTNSTR
jgi:outer membrane biosynthesis protein TonB